MTSCSSRRVLIGVDLLAELRLATGQVLLRELPHGLDGEGSGPESRLADGHLEDLGRRGGRAVLVEQLLHRLTDGEPGQYLRGVVRRRLLPLPPGQPEDERALSVQHGSPLPRDRVGDLDEVRGADALGPLHRDDPGALRRVAVLGHLVEVGLGEEPGVGHQALVHRTELVDAELGVGDESAIPADGFLGQQQMAEDLLHRGVTETDRVDVGCGRRTEQVRLERIEGQAGAHPLEVPLAALGGIRSATRTLRLIALVDQTEQGRQ